MKIITIFILLVLSFAGCGNPPYFHLKNKWNIDSREYHIRDDANLIDISVSAAYFYVPDITMVVEIGVTIENNGQDTIYIKTHTERLTSKYYSLFKINNMYTSSGTIAVPGKMSGGQAVLYKYETKNWPFPYPVLNESGWVRVPKDEEFIFELPVIISKNQLLKYEKLYFKDTGN